jgi:hypothetical protein
MALIFAFANSNFVFHHALHSAIRGLLRNTIALVERKAIAVRTPLEGSVRNNRRPLIIRISDLLKMQRKVLSWSGARRCTNCDNATV